MSLTILPEAAIASVPMDGTDLDIPDSQQDVLSELPAPAVPIGGVMDIAAWECHRPPGHRMLAPVKMDGEIVARTRLAGQAAELTPLDRRAVEHAARLPKQSQHSQDRAKDVYVHPDTVGRRVRKAEELLHVSLADTESLIHVGMALMADQVVQVSSGSPRPR